MVLCDLNNSQREYLSRAQTPDLLSPKMSEGSARVGLGLSAVDARSGSRASRRSRQRHKQGTALFRFNRIA